MDPLLSEHDLKLKTELPNVQLHQIILEYIPDCVFCSELILQLNSHVQELHSWSKSATPALSPFTDLTVLETETENLDVRSEFEPTSPRISRPRKCTNTKFTCTEIIDENYNESENKEDFKDRQGHVYLNIESVEMESEANGEYEEEVIENLTDPLSRDVIEPPHPGSGKHYVQRNAKTFDCDICGKILKNKRNLIYHEKTHLKEKGMPHKCESCGQGFPRLATLNDHLRTLCGSSQPQLPLEEPHVQTIHQGKEKNHFQRKCLTFDCETCGKVFKRFHNLTEHKLTHLTERPHKCEICGRGFNRLKNLTDHIQAHSRVLPFKCETCGKEFLCQKTLRTHIKTHIAGGLTCEICGKTCLRRGDLKRHENEFHRERKNHECEECGKQFSSSSRLRLHMVTHTGEKPFMCETCGKSFARPHCLVVHKKTHTGERPHKCESCELTFFRMDKLILHMREHTGEKPFICEFCGERFTRKEKLKFHRLSHTGEKPWNCDVCGRGFKRSDKLAIHKKIHSGEKPFKCDECEFCCKRKDNLALHKRIHTKRRARVPRT